MVKKLSDKQELFCLEYLKDLNATQAAKRAGYSHKTANEQGSQLLARLSISSRIQTLNAKRFNNAELQGLNVIKELALLSFSDIQDYIEIDDGGAITAKRFEEMKGKASKAIKSIKEKKVIREAKDGSEAMLVESTFELTLWEKPKSLELLGKHHELFVDKVKVVADPFKDKTDQELAEELKAIRS